MHIFDAHFHIINPEIAPLSDNGYTPEPYTVDDYRSAAEKLGIVGGAVVAGSFHGFREEPLLDALQRLGPHFVGVAQLPPNVSDESILRLDQAGVRAIRANIRRGLPYSFPELFRLAERVHQLAGWHTEVYADGAQLAQWSERLLDLPRIVVDHLGLTSEGLPALYRLVESGAYVKLTGFGRLNFDPSPVIRELATVNANALLFGTDLPSTRAPRPFQESDLIRIVDSIDANDRDRVYYHNAVALYRPTHSIGG